MAGSHTFRNLPLFFFYQKTSTQKNRIPLSTEITNAVIGQKAYPKVKSNLFEYKFAVLSIVARPL